MAAKEQPWMNIAWSEEIQKRIYQHWGNVFTSRQKYDSATQYYTKSLEYKLGELEDFEALYNRSVCRGANADTEAALKDDKNALSIKKNDYPANVQLTKALYELNDFENAKIEASNKMRTFYGHKKQPFKYLLNVLDVNNVDNMGEYMGPFLLENQKILPKVVERHNKLINIDDRPLWKRLKELDKCDVVSILEEEDVLLHPREVARRNLNFRVFRQVYFRNLYNDSEFLKMLKTNKTLLLPQTKKSTLFLSNTVKRNYDVVLKFLRMLEARSPMYTERFKMCPNQKIEVKKREDHLFRVQYQTRRDMFIILEKVKALRKRGRLEKLIKLVELAMGDYVVLKTRRVMPRKFEFMNEIYNYLALAHMDKLIVPTNILNYAVTDRLDVLMGLPLEKDKPSVAFVFGDKSTYNEPDAPDYGYIAYKRLLDRLEKRFYFAKYPIEKCYLLYEMARNHITQNKFEESLSLAKKSVEEANVCRNSAWIFLTNLMMCRLNVATKKLERVTESLVTANNIAAELKEQKLIHFMETCTEMNNMANEARRKAKEEEMRRISKQQ